MKPEDESIWSVIIGFILTWILNEVRKYMDSKREKAKQKVLQQRVGEALENTSTKTTVLHNAEIDAKIYPLLWTIRDRYNALRVYLVQFHNGQSFYTGQGIQRKTVTHEVPYEYFGGVLSVKPTHDNILISEMTHKVIMQLKNAIYYYISKPDDIAKDNAELANFMGVYSAKSMIYLRINNIDNEPAALLIVHFPSYEQINRGHLAELLEYRKRIETIFINYSRKPSNTKSDK